MTQKTPKKSAGFCNTPQNSQGSQTYSGLTVSIDYLTLVYKYPDVETFHRSTAFLLDWLGDSALGEDKGTRVHGRAFQSHYKTMFGAEVLWNRLEDKTIDCMYTLSGGTLSHVEPRNLARALMYLDQWYVTCNRLDIFVDGDKRKMSELRDNIFYAKISGAHAGFHKMKEITEYDKRNNAHTTLYIGSRKSVGTFARIYDKIKRNDVTKEPEVACVRFEVECKSGRAASLFRIYMSDILVSAANDSYDFGKIYSRLFSTAISRLHFYEGVKQKNLERNVIAVWWHEFLTAIAYDPLKIPKVSKVSTLKKTLDWLQRSVAPSLAMVKKCLGGAYSQYIMELLEIGTFRLSEYQRKLIEWYVSKITVEFSEENLQCSFQS